MTDMSTRLVDALLIQSTMLDQLASKYWAARARRAARNWRLVAVLEE